METPPSPGAEREVHCAEAIGWLRERRFGPEVALVTSLPDVSELRLDLAVWREWFLGAVRLAAGSVAPEAVAVFFQSDIKRDGRWIDKGAMVVRAAEDAGSHVLLHKIVCRREPGRLTYGRPGYTHLLAVSRARRCPEVLPMPDIIADAGRQPWVRAMGIRAAAHAVRFVRDVAGARTVVDPFCGVGTVLAVANRMGLKAIGVDRSPRRCERARQLEVRADEL